MVKHIGRETKLEILCKYGTNEVSIISKST